MSAVLQCGLLAPSHLSLFYRLDAWLAARGHAITNVLAGPPPGRELGLRDLHVHPIPPSEVLRDGVQSIAALRDPNHRAAIYQAWLLDGLAQRVEFVRRLIDARKPAVILCDPMSIEGIVAAECSRIPWIGLSSNFAQLVPRDPEDPYEAALRSFEPLAHEAMHRFGVTSRFHGGEWVSPTHTLIPGAPAWAAARDSHHTMCGYVPDSRAPAVEVPRRFPSWPLIVVSFGSTLHLEPAFIAQFVRAAEGVEAEFLVSARHFVRDYRGSIPPNFVCGDSIPQVAALRQAALLITHGGANSILEAIAHAVPIVVIPICSDQFRNAKLVERLGVGTSLDARAVTPSSVQDAVAAGSASRDRESLAQRRQELSAATSSSALDGIAPFLAEQESA